MLALDIEWLGPAYEAGLDGGRPEWPPHPARAFCALVAVAEEGSADDGALRWLESLPRPHVLFPAAQPSVVRSYVPTNATGGGKGDTSQQYVARTNGEQRWPRSLLSAPSARLVWPDAVAPADVGARLDELARRVPYLGRATSPALLSFSTDPGDPYSQELEPAATGPSLLRAPYPGYLDALRVAHGGRQPATTADRSYPYRSPVAITDVPEPVPVAYPDLLTLGFPPGQGIDGRHAVAVARASKAAVLQRLGKPGTSDPWEPFAEDRLALLHGHHDGRRRQCSFIALPFVDRPHATGYLMGVGLGLSPDLEVDLRKGVLRLFGLDHDEGPRLSSFFVPGLGKLGLSSPDGWTTEPTAWQRPSTVWDSVLPIVLDRWPKRSYPVEEVIADGCVMAGYPRPEEVEARRVSTVEGAPWIARHDTRRPRPGASRPATHAVLRFGRPVPGPVVVGHLRHLGLGLCRPRSKRDGG